MTPNQRRFIRAQSRIVTFIAFPQTGKVRRALTKDIGAGGVCVITEQLLEPGTMVDLEMTLPDRTAPIRCSAEVVWSRPIGGPRKEGYENPTAETGVKFVRIDPKDRTLLIQYATINAPPTTET